MKKDAKDLYSKIGYTFINPQLLDQALTHRSHKGQHNERLEFLGDGVLDLIVSEHLYKKYPNYSEGRLSKVKSVIVKRTHLNKLAKRLDIHKVLKSDLNTSTDSEIVFKANRIGNPSFCSSTFGM